MALGASRSAVLGMIVRYGLTLTLIGLILGLGVSLALTKTLASLLYGVSASDPVDIHLDSGSHECCGGYCVYCTGLESSLC
jgi:ABC-type antimicrobial peptide transport system permease subunit